jgi:hypothetical protein
LLLVLHFEQHLGGTLRELNHFVLMLESALLESSAAAWGWDFCSVTGDAEAHCVAKQHAPTPPTGGAAE